jgi:hypothetical protein
MGKVGGLLRGSGLVFLGLILGVALMVAVQRYLDGLRSKELMDIAVAMSNLDGPWPVDDPTGDYRALRDRREAAVHFLLAAAETSEGKRPAAELYLGLLFRGEDWCISQHYLERVRQRGSEFHELDSWLAEAKRGCHVDDD